jgi:5-bromo-4-chloroindolyl phosphate hydrolysis protein
MQRQIDKREVAINKVKRTPFVIFLRSILPFIIVIIIIVVSFLIGFWDIKMFEYNESKLDNVSTAKLDAYLADFVGRNIFTVTRTKLNLYLSRVMGLLKMCMLKRFYLRS